MKRSMVAVSIVVAGTLSLTGCSSMTEPWNDAPVEQKYDNPAEIYSMPDGFANVASKCDAHGNRMFVTREGTAKGGGKAVTVIKDPTCKPIEK